MMWHSRWDPGAEKKYWVKTKEIVQTSVNYYVSSLLIDPIIITNIP